MESISEKLGVHDFFNVLVGGVILSIGSIYIYGALVDEKIYSKIDVGLKELIVFIAISYVLGMAIQEVGSILDRYFGHFRSNALQTFLKSSSDIIGNSQKKLIYRKLGKEILQNNQIKFENEFTNEQCEYIYGYCCYYIEVRGKHAKIEKMRALFDMSRTMWSAFSILLLAYTLVAVKMDSQSLAVSTFIFNAAIFLVLILLSYYRMRKTLRYKIRMTMGLYENIINLKKNLVIRDALHMRRDRIL